MNEDWGRRFGKSDVNPLALAMGSVNRKWNTYGSHSYFIVIFTKSATLRFCLSDKMANPFLPA